MDPVRHPGSLDPAGGGGREGRGGEGRGGEGRGGEGRGGEGRGGGGLLKFNNVAAMHVL